MFIFVGMAGHSAGSQTGSAGMHMPLMMPDSGMPSGTAAQQSPHSVMMAADQHLAVQKAKEQAVGASAGGGEASAPFEMISALQKLAGMQPQVNVLSIITCLKLYRVPNTSNFYFDL